LKQSQLSIEPYVAATIKTWPAKYETLSTETENSLKNQTFSALTSCSSVKEFGVIRIFLAI